MRFGEPSLNSAENSVGSTRGHHLGPSGASTRSPAQGYAIRVIDLRNAGSCADAKVLRDSSGTYGSQGSRSTITEIKSLSLHT